ncbi:MAG: DUF2238 domain-containing protein [Azoarcus sp.]|nr:DUF2238 domain-containing protein [Azoarcus sp.]
MKNIHKILLLFFFLVLSWSWFGDTDFLTWCLEVAPGVLGVAILALTYKRFQFTDFAYIFILAHCVILFVGGRYTYAEVPLFDWIRDVFDMTRNHYDKVGHFAQGFIPALITREILIRFQVVKTRGWTNVMVISICLAISAIYEIIEWFAAEIIGESAESFLGTQGYVWDTQSDMLCALIGASCMLLFLSKAHDNAMKVNCEARQTLSAPESRLH